MKKYYFNIDKKHKNQRLDKFLGDNIKGFSRSFMNKLIESGEVLVNNEKTKSSYKINRDDYIEVNIPEKKTIEIKKENLQLDIIYENKDYLIINKKAGMIVHPSDGNTEGTLVNGLLNLDINLSDIEGEVRPGIVHRLDKETTGLIVVCKTNEMHLNLKNQLLNKTMDREYLVLVHGRIKADTGTIEAPIGRNKKDRIKRAVVYGAREARSDFIVIKRFKNHTFLKVILETGRTHQIRVHMSHIKHPVVGDEMYGIKNDKIKNLMLHAYKVGFDDLNGERKYFSKPINEKFRNILKSLSRE
ncbi:MAG: RluA family pseudouridine synthase [Clostridium sp.]|nr:RluA family pseudouridine synthase [Clostridium sp.]